MLQLAAEIAHCHNERVDGKGYPRGLLGDEIPLTSRIVALADVFDALTSLRPYKAAWSLDQACSHIESQRNRHFDRACVDAFFNAIDAVGDVMRQHAEDSEETKCFPVVQLCDTRPASIHAQVTGQTVETASSDEVELF